VRRALAFLTPVGGGDAAVPTAAAVAWFPPVGALVGLAVGGTWWLAAQVWPPAVAAALALAVDLVLTGMLHLDGLVDSADGLLAPLERERRLEVMADPRAGAFGVGAAVVVLLLRWTALASQRVSVLLVAGLWCASRTVMATTLRTLPYVRPGGLATAFRSTGSSATPVAVGGAVAGMVLGGVLVAVGRGGAGLVALVAGVAAAVGVVALAARRLGGFPGDVLGAAGMVGETAALVVAAARW
jgi:adenosylcobinamide-GDP ribazoletransferase